MRKDGHVSAPDRGPGVRGRVYTFYIYEANCNLEIGGLRRFAFFSNEILDTAAQLFFKNGYHVGVDRIIADSGVAKMTGFVSQTTVTLICGRHTGFRG